MGARTLVLLSMESLFPNHAVVHPSHDTVFLAIEDVQSIPRNNSAFSVLLHLSMMREHIQRLRANFPVSHYSLSRKQTPSWTELFNEALDEHEIEQVCLYESSSYIPIADIIRSCTERNVSVNFFPSPRFILPSDFSKNISHKANDREFVDFYLSLRKKLRILVGAQGEPIEQEWSVGKTSNGQKAHEILPVFELSRQTDEIAQQLSDKFPELMKNRFEFDQATVRKDALILLDCFLKHHLHEVPIPQNSKEAKRILKELPIMPYIDAGLLLPLEVIHKAESFGARFDLKFQHVENLVRLILGWREYIQLLKIRAFNRKKANRANHQR